MTSFFSGPNPVEKSVEEATAANLVEVNYALNLGIAENIDKSNDHGKELLKYIRKRLNNSNKHVQLLTIQLLETCVKNTHNNNFFMLIAGKDTMELLFKLVTNTKTDNQVRQKILILIQSLYTTFKDDARMAFIGETYGKILGKGILFPTIEDVPIFTPGPNKNIVKKPVPQPQPASSSGQSSQPPSLPHNHGASDYYTNYHGAANVQQHQDYYANYRSDQSNNVSNGNSSMSAEEKKSLPPQGIHPFTFESSEYIAKIKQDLVVVINYCTRLRDQLVTSNDINSQSIQPLVPVVSDIRNRISRLIVEIENEQLLDLCLSVCEIVRLTLELYENKKANIKPTYDSLNWKCPATLLPYTNSPAAVTKSNNIDPNNQEKKQENVGNAIQEEKKSIKDDKVTPQAAILDLAILNESKPQSNLTNNAPTDANITANNPSHTTSPSPILASSGNTSNPPNASIAANTPQQVYQPVYQSNPAVQYGLQSNASTPYYATNVPVTSSSPIVSSPNPFASISPNALQYHQQQATMLQQQQQQQQQLEPPSIVSPLSSRGEGVGEGEPGNNMANASPGNNNNIDIFASLSLNDQKSSPPINNDNNAGNNASSNVLDFSGVPEPSASIDVFDPFAADTNITFDNNPNAANLTNNNVGSNSNNTSNTVSMFDDLLNFGSSPSVQQIQSPQANETKNSTNTNTILPIPTELDFEVGNIDRRSICHLSHGYLNLEKHEKPDFGDMKITKWDPIPLSQLDWRNGIKSKKGFIYFKSDQLIFIARQISPQNDSTPQPQVKSDALLRCDITTENNWDKFLNKVRALNEQDYQLWLKTL
jgi:hypothetical protein